MGPWSCKSCYPSDGEFQPVSMSTPKESNLLAWIEDWASITPNTIEWRIGQGSVDINHLVLELESLHQDIHRGLGNQ